MCWQKCSQSKKIRFTQINKMRSFRLTKTTDETNNNKIN